MNATGEQAWVLYLLLNDDHPSGVGVGLWSGLDQPVEEGGRVIGLTYSRRTDRGWFGAEHVAWRVELARGAGE